MKKLIINSKNYDSCNTIFNDLNIDKNSIYDFFMNHEYDYILDILNNINLKFQHINYPLLEDNKEDYFLYYQNLLVLNQCINLTKLREEESELFDFQDSDYVDLITGYYVFTLIGENFITLDHKKYNFNSSIDMFLSLSAFIFNYTKKDYDKRVVNVNFDNCYYSYENHIHGDFRLVKYDINQSTSFCPILKQNIPFSEPKFIGSLCGYHSIEHTFLNILLNFLYYTNQSDLLFKDSNLDNFLSNFMMQNQSYGAFADAGQRPFMLSALFDKEKFVFPNLYMEDHGYYKPVLLNNVLNFYQAKTDENYSTTEVNQKISFLIEKEHAYYLIKGLFEKTLKGNGRSSFNILKDLLMDFNSQILN